MTMRQLRHAAKCVVEPASSLGRTVQLENIESGCSRLIGDLAVLPPEGQNRFRRGDVIFSKLRPYLAKSLLVTDSVHGSGELLCMRPEPATEARYLAYLTLSRPWLDHANMTSYGTKMPRTSWEQMASLKIHLPDTGEQRRIADFLDDRVSRIDQIIAGRRVQVELAFSWQQSRLVAQLLSEGDPTAPLRHLGVQVTTGPFGTVFSASEYVDGGVPMINPTHIKDGELLPDPSHSVSLPTAARLSRHQLRDGDLVVSRKGDIGRTAVVLPYQDGWICGSDSIALHASGSKILPELLDLLLKLDATRDQLLAESNAATMPSLSEGNLLSLRVPAIDVPDQVQRIEDARHTRASTQVAVRQTRRSIELLQEYKQSLITAAVTGEFDVSTAGNGIPG